MKKLNEQATRIFCGLLEKLKDQEYVQLKNVGHMPLSMEKITDLIQTDEGPATLYSLSHHYEQNGDLMYDPEVCFIVIDKRQHPKDYAAIHIYPQSFRQDNIGMQDESIHMSNDKITSFIKLWQEEHCLFANLWLKNIKTHGFLNDKK